MKLSEAINEWLNAKRIENLSERTIDGYDYFINQMLDYLGDMPLEQFDASKVRAFIGYQGRREGRFGELSDATIMKYYSVVRSFSRWLADQDYKIKVPTNKVKPPKVERKLPEALSDDEVERLYRYLKAYCSERVQLIFEFFMDTGARLTEVVDINIDDVNLRDGWVKVYGKGRKERILPLGRNLKRDLKAYIEKIRPMIAETDEQALFVTQQGSRYAREGLSTLIKTKMKKVGVKGHYGPHKLRHTFATNYLRNQGGLEQLRIQMGHTDISTTQIYLSLVPDDLVRAQQHASPNDKFRDRLDI